MSQTPRKLAELDSVRGIMAVWVYVSHILFFGGMHGHHIQHILSQGGLAVFVFVILSGFAITTSLNSGSSRYRDFIARRFFRIYPAFVISLLLGLTTSYLYPDVLAGLSWIPPIDVDRITQRVASEDAHRGWHLLAHLTMLHGAIPDKALFGASLAFCGPLWSLSLEWQFYLLAPIIVSILASPRQRWLGLAILIAIAILGPRVSAPYFDQVPSFLPQLLGLFVLGILTAIWIPRLVGKDDALVGIGAAIIAVTGLSGRVDLLIPICIWVSTLWVATLQTGPFITQAKRVLSNTKLVKFGERSYGFYVLHMPLLLAVAKILSVMDLNRSPLIYMGILFLVTAPLTVVLSWLMFDYVESPINRWAKRRFGGTKLASVSSLDATVR